MIPNFIMAAVFRLAQGWQNHHRVLGSARGRGRINTITSVIFILCVCGLRSKAATQTYRHFNPPPAPIIGP